LYGPSTGIYQVAPAAARGKGALYDYILSSSDKVITNIPNHQNPNVDLGTSAADEYGHQFIETYLNKAGYTIATDMVDMFEKLQTYETKNSDGKCLGKQDTSIVYLATKSLLSVSDFAINVTATGVQGIWNTTANGYTYLASLFLGVNTVTQTASVATADSSDEGEVTELSSPVYLKEERKYPGILTNAIITSVTSEETTLSVSFVQPTQTIRQEQSTNNITETTTDVEVLPVSTAILGTEVISVPSIAVDTSTSLIQTGGSGLTGSQLAAAELPLTFTVDTDTTTIYGRSEILLFGTATEGAQIDIPYGDSTVTVTASTEGKWEHLYTFPRGTTTISLSAYKDGYISTGASINIISLPGTREPSVRGLYTKAESPYLLERLATSPEYTTTVEAGTVIKFIPSLTNGIYAGCPFYCSGSVEKLTVGDPSGEPVIFTTSTDDSILGDTNDDGSATSPLPNSYTWNQGFFADTDMYHADMRYASHHLYGGDLSLSDYIGAKRGEGISTTYEPGNPLSLTISDTTFVRANIYQHSGTLTLQNVSFTNSESLPRARIGNNGTLYLENVTCDGAFDTCLEGGWNGPLQQIVYRGQSGITPLVFTSPFYIPAAGAIFGGPVSLLGTQDKPLYIYILGALFPEIPVSSPALVEQFVVYVNELGEEVRKGWE
jgi:hypothetical protein